MITLWGRNNSTNVKKVLLTLEELELPYEQILAGREFGINHDAGNDSNLLIVFYVQIMPDDFVMQLHRF